MESALVRQPRVSPAPPRAGRALRVTLGLAGAMLAASVVSLQVLAAGHLFPGGTVWSPAAPALIAAGSPGAAAIAPPTPTPTGGQQPADKPAATDRHG